MANIEIHNLSKTFYIAKNRRKPASEVMALQNVSLHIPSGSFFVLMGGSGSGKTTLLRILAGIESFDDGDFFWNGVDATKISQEEKSMAYVPQNYVLFPYATVYQNIAMGLKDRGLTTEEIIACIRRVAKQAGITAILTRKPRQLSGGEQQRVAIARALAREADVNLFDEPLSNVDSKNRGTFLRLFLEMKSRHNATFLYSTHRLEEALTLADQMCLLQQGKVIGVGTPQELYDKPATLQIFSFLRAGKSLTFSGVVKNRTLLVANTKIQLSLPDGSYTFGLSYEDAYFSEEGIPIRIQNVLWEEDGPHLSFASEDGTFRGTLLSPTPHEVGETMHVTFNAKNLFAFRPNGTRVD